MPTRERELDSKCVPTLLVEDNELLRKSISQSLKLLGCKVTAMAGGTEAKQAIEDGRQFELLVSDVRVSDPVDGIALANWIRRQGLATAVILMSGYHEQAVDPAFHFLHKPFSLDQLTAAVRHALDNQQPPSIH